MRDLDEIKHKSLGETVKLIILDLKLMVASYCYTVWNDNASILKVKQRILKAIKITGLKLIVQYKLLRKIKNKIRFLADSFELVISLLDENSWLRSVKGFLSWKKKWNSFKRQINLACHLEKFGFVKVTLFLLDYVSKLHLYRKPNSLTRNSMNKGVSF